MTILAQRAHLFIFGGVRSSNLRSFWGNYFGEILLWLGITIISFPVLSGLQLVTLISPIFVYLLLTKISGIPLLERKADKRWSKDPEYVKFKENTPVLFLKKP